MAEVIKSGFKKGMNIKLIPGSKIYTSKIRLDIKPIPSNITTIIINYENNGVKPTGNNVKVYKKGMSIVPLPLIGIPVVNETERTLTIIIQAYVGISSTDQYLVEFEVI